MAKHLFKPGQSGNVNGRPKGSANKKTLQFQQILEEQGFDPAKQLVEIYRRQIGLFKKSQKIHPNDVAEANVILTGAEKTLNDICQYVYPRKKAIDHTGDLGVMSLTDFMKLAGDGEKDDE